MKSEKVAAKFTGKQTQNEVTRYQAFCSPAMEQDVVIYTFIQYTFFL